MNPDPVMAKNWEKVASTVWPVLVRMAKDRIKPCSYDDLARKIKTTETKLTSRTIRYALAPIQNYCLDNRYPVLTALVVQRVSGRPGDGFAWDCVYDWEEELDKVYKFTKWKKEIAEKSFLSTHTAELLARKIIKKPDEANKIYATRSRGDGQRIFRYILLEIYNRQCAVCKLGFVEALEAAHIIPWSDCEEAERTDSTNGILLCANHHKLFDSKIITFNDKYKIEIKNRGRKKGRKFRYSKSDEQALALLQGKSLNLPVRKDHRPSKEFLRRRNKAT